MNKDFVLKIAGIVAIIGGTIALFMSGANEAMITSLVGGVIVLIGLVLAFFKDAKLFIKK